jgi:large subunit ribosomal protein L6
MASHIGTRPITVPEGVTVTIKDGVVDVKGKLGEDSYTLPSGISAKVEDGKVLVSTLDDENETRAKHGLSRAIIASLVEGVTKGFEKKLEIVGTGYRVAPKGTGLTFSLGFSHTIEVPAPEGIKLTAPDQTHITVSGIDKQKVGEIAAQIRRLRPPEPYKGKGIKYEGEYIRRKAGKAGK